MLLSASVPPKTWSSACPGAYGPDLVGRSTKAYPLIKQIRALSQSPRRMTSMLNLSPRRGGRVADPAEKTGESNDYVEYFFCNTVRVLVPYLQGRRYLPSAVSPHGSYQQFSTRTRSILGLFPPVTAVQPFGANSTTSGSH